MKKNYCYECDTYKGYYMKGRKEFLCADVGYCFIKHTIVKQDGSCESFRPKKPLPLEQRKKEAYAAIIRAVSTLGEVKQILEEDKELWGKK